MKHSSRIDRYSYTEASRAHAASDCLAALSEDMWADAAKLLSMHGEPFLPKVRTGRPFIRHYLDFYACQFCSDQSALLTTEDEKGHVVRQQGDIGAYKATAWPTRRASSQSLDKLQGSDWIGVHSYSRTSRTGPGKVRGCDVFAPRLLFCPNHSSSATHSPTEGRGHYRIVSDRAAPHRRWQAGQDPADVSLAVWTWHSLSGFTNRQIGRDVYDCQGMRVDPPRSRIFFRSEISVHRRHRDPIANMPHKTRFR